MHPDPFHPIRDRAVGTPDRDDLNAFQIEQSRPAFRVSRRDLLDGALVFLVTFAILFMLGAALFEGLARAEARPIGCDGLTASACRALMAEGGVW